MKYETRCLIKRSCRKLKLGFDVDGEPGLWLDVGYHKIMLTSGIFTRNLDRPHPRAIPRWGQHVEYDTIQIVLNEDVNAFQVALIFEDLTFIEFPGLSYDDFAEVTERVKEFI